MTWRRWAVLFDLMRVGLRKPAAVFGALRMQHIKTLVYAVRHEPPSLILHNFGQLLGNGARTSLHPEKRQFEFEGITIYLEHMLQLPGRIEIKGWCHSPENLISKIQLHGDENCIGEMKTGLDRPDLEQRYGRQYSKAGFHGLFEVRESVALWKIVILKLDGVSIHCPIPDYSAESRYQEWTLIDKDFRLTPRQIMRQLKKSSGEKKLKVALAMSSEQQGLLQLHNLPCIIQTVPDEFKEADLVIRLHPKTYPQPDLVWQVILAFERSGRNAQLLYWDEDYVNQDKTRSNPVFKPRWNPDYLLSWNYIGLDFAYRPTGREHQILFTHPIEVWKNAPKLSAAHLPCVLSHRMDSRSEAEANDEEYWYRKELLSVQHSGIRVEQGLYPTTFRVHYPLEEPQEVTIIVPFRDKLELLKSCIQSVEKFPPSIPLKWLLVNNCSELQETREYLDRLLSSQSDIKVLDYPEEFNFANLHNTAMKQVDTPFVLFMNNDIEALHDGWLEAMMEHAQRKEVGAVGALLEYPDGTIQHAGVLVGIGGAADHAFKYLPVNEPGYGMRAQVVQQLSAVTAACMLMRTEVYKEIGGMDGRHFSVAFNDVDFCLQLRQKGYNIIFTPYARLSHKESATRGIDQSPKQRERARREIRAFQDKWSDFLKEGDPFYHPMWSISSGHYLFRG